MWQGCCPKEAESFRSFWRLSQDLLNARPRKQELQACEPTMGSVKHVSFVTFVTFTHFHPNLSFLTLDPCRSFSYRSQDDPQFRRNCVCLCVCVSGHDRSPRALVPTSDNHHGYPWSLIGPGTATMTCLAPISTPARWRTARLSCWVLRFLVDYLCICV